MTVDFAGFAPAPALSLGYRLEQGLTAALHHATAPVSLVTWAGMLLGMLFALGVVLYRRTRTVYRVISTAVIASMLSVTLMTNTQIRLYAVAQAARQSEQEARQAQAENRTAAAEQLRAPSVAPHTDPLAAADLQAALAVDASTDPYFDPSCASDPDGDIDGDTLTNLQECLVGTLVDNADTDQDGLADNLEVAGHSYNGQVWYLDPLNADTNNDGIADGKEWHLDGDGNGAPDDTDGDGTPDIWDDDNDGDGIRDNLDLSAYAHTKGTRTFTGANPLELTLDNIVSNELTKVEFQLIPTNPEHLWYTNNVFDWPVNDRQGQIQDADGLTFYDVDKTLDPSPNDDGDIRMAPMLEIEINGGRETLPSDDVLAQLGISVLEVVTGTQYAVYAPVQLVTDSTGEANVGFYSRMYYQPTGAWGEAHKVRLVWAIQALNDTCTTFDNGICSTYDPDGMNQLQIVQTYDDDWFLTGMMVTEEHNADIALVYEDPAVTAQTYADKDEPFYFDTLFGLMDGLDKTLLAGADCQPGYAGPGDPDGTDTCVPDGKRDMTIDALQTRFDHRTNSGISAQKRWNLPNVLTVERNSYESLDLGMLDTTITRTVQLLDEVFTGPATQSTITPTIMLAFEQTYRAVNMDEALGGTPNLAWSGNGLTVNLPQSGDNAVTLDTMASVKWTPYAYDPATGWSAADIYAFYDTLTAQMGDSFTDISDPEEASTYATMANLTYLSGYNGASSLVQTGDVIVSYSYQQPDKPLSIVLVADGGKVVKQVVSRSYTYGPQLVELVQEYEVWSYSVRLYEDVPTADVSATAFLKMKVYSWWQDMGASDLLVGVVGIFLTVAAVTFWIVSASTHSTTVRQIATDGLAVSIGTLLLALGTIKPILKVIKIATTIADLDDVGFGLALFNTLTDASSVIGVNKVLPLIGFLFPSASHWVCSSMPRAGTICTRAWSPTTNWWR
ncbi:MAG: hypothetical protein R2851_17425 [Caldilineaceae bacterium]